MNFKTKWLLQREGLAARVTEPVLSLYVDGSWRSLPDVVPLLCVIVSVLYFPKVFIYGVHLGNLMASLSRILALGVASQNRILFSH